MRALSDVIDHIDHFQARVCREAILEAEAATWERRAVMLEWARPRTGDWHGQATRAELRARYDLLTAQAQACRLRARVSLLGTESP